MLYDSIATFLLAESSLTDLVGQRVYPHGKTISGALPMVTCQIPDCDVQFFLGSSTNLAKPIVRFHIVAETVLETYTISHVLINLLHNFSGSMGDDEVRVIFQGLLDPDAQPDEEVIIYQRWLHFEFRCDLSIV